MKKIRILHSFSDKYKVFRKFCELTFSIDNLDNTYVKSLNEINEINNSYDLVIVHFLRDEDCEFLNEKNINIPLILFSWGADIFQLGKFYNSFLMPKTKALRTKHYFSNNIYVAVKKIIHTVFPSILDFRKKNKIRLKAFQKFDYIVPVLPEDYTLLQKKYPGIIARQYHLNYANPVLQEIKPFTRPGEHILLGNSSTYTNNHIEAIDSLNKLDIGKRKIIIPLSYGNSSLAQDISSYSQKKLRKEQLELLTKFLPADEYSEKIASCGIVILNHLRQQAMGNIVEALINGSHIYLQSSSPAFQFLKKKGFNISAFDKAKELNMLSEEAIETNRSLTYEVFGIKQQQKKLASLFEQLLA